MLYLILILLMLDVLTIIIGIIKCIIKLTLPFILWIFVVGIIISVVEFIIKVATKDEIDRKEIDRRN